jgi:hypothetical protein
MSPFLVLMLSRTWQWHSVSGVGGRGGKGRPLSPFHPAQRLIELHCTHLPVLRFPKKNFAPGWPQSDEPKLGRPIASPALAFVFLVQQDSQRSFHACDNAQRRHLYFFRAGRFSVILSPRMILTRLARLGEPSHRDAVLGSIVHFTFSGQRWGKLSVG